jgi:hypothetical protein
MTSQAPLACTLQPTERQARGDAVAQLLATATQIEEREDGYAFAFPPDERQVRDVLDFVLFERACCAFLTFRVEFPAPHDRVWLELRGDAEVKAVIQAMFVTSARVAESDSLTA